MTELPTVEGQFESVSLLIGFVCMTSSILFLFVPVGHEVPSVVAVLCESIAGSHQLIAAKTHLTCLIK